MTERARTPNRLRTRQAVRRALREVPAGARILVAVSGGADSLALADAVAFVAPEQGIHAGAILVDHGLQEGSAEVTARAAEQVRGLGLSPVLTERVVIDGRHTGGPEAAARSARYAAFVSLARRTNARLVLTGHTRDDQAEQVLLALTRGSGTRSIAGIPPSRSLGGDGGTTVLRPFLDADAAIDRATTREACREADLSAWSDPHNDDDRFRRVRVRHALLPQLERELGHGIVAGLARSADLARDDADALDLIAARAVAAACVVREAGTEPDEGTPRATLDIAAVAGEPRAVLGRVLRAVSDRLGGPPLSRSHVRAVAALVDEWRGQGPVNVPGFVVSRSAGRLEWRPLTGSAKR